MDNKKPKSFIINTVLESDYSALSKFFMLLWLEARYLSQNEKQKQCTWQNIEKYLEDGNE